MEEPTQGNQQEPWPMSPHFRVIRGQTLRELSKADLIALHGQLLAELLGQADLLHKPEHAAMVAELDWIEAELWTRSDQ